MFPHSSVYICRWRKADTWEGSLLTGLGMLLVHTYSALTEHSPWTAPVCLLVETRGVVAGEKMYDGSWADGVSLDRAGLWIGFEPYF